jgi:hypothetical protein
MLYEADKSAPAVEGFGVIAEKFLLEPSKGCFPPTHSYPIQARGSRQKSKSWLIASTETG